MKKLFPIFLLFVISSTAESLPVDSLIEQTLNLFDLDMYNGRIETPKLRLGHYSNEIAIDSNSEIADNFKIKYAYRIWHIIPHTSADEAGLFIDDTLI